MLRTIRRVVKRRGCVIVAGSSGNVESEEVRSSLLSMSWTHDLRVVSASRISEPREPLRRQFGNRVEQTVQGCRCAPSDRTVLANLDVGGRNL